jgi:hypothetical protein
MDSSRDIIHTALGSILAIVALAFGVVGWLLSMGILTGYGDPLMWFVCAAILGVLAIGIVLDEARVFADASLRQTESALSWLLMLLALIAGSVGFILGFWMNSDTWMFWVGGGLILAITSLGIMADEGRRLRAANRAVADEVVGGLLSIAAIVIGAVGFLFGILGQPHPMAWLQGGVICSLSAVAFMFDGERRAAAAASRRVPQPDMAGTEGQAFIG